ncbi:MAG: hypothetical protein KDD35_08390, partial [Bdellovibrionales bacterium]|nr:hypothetical protein [Bdellovibrionales bacterium]
VLFFNFMNSSLVRRRPFLITFFIFYLSLACWENIYWSFQSSFHFVFLFGFSAIYFGFKPNLTWGNLLAFVLSSIFCMYSMSLGVPFVLGVLPLVVWYHLGPWALRNGQYWGVSTKLAVGALVIFFALWQWMAQGSLGQGSIHPLAWPWTTAFWSHYLGVLGLGFGINSLKLAQLGGLFVLVIYCAFAIRLVRQFIKKEGGFNNGENLKWLAVGTGVLAAGASISLGRGNFGSDQALATRYVEVSMMMIPFLVIALGDLSRLFSQMWQKRIMVLFFTLLFSGFFDSWDFMKYSRLHQSRLRDKDCLAQALELNSEGDCPYYFPEALQSRLQRAEELKVNFIEVLRKRDSRF